MTDTTGLPPITAAAVHAAAVAQHGEDKVSAEQLGATYQRMLDDRGARRRNQSYFTPEPLAASVTRFTLEVALRQVGPSAAQLLRLVICDPACGAGIFLVHAARQLAHAYAARLTGAEPGGDLVLAVMPQVIFGCVHGVDVDPVAAELARLALSLETAGVVPPDALAGHVVCGNTLQGTIPPALTTWTTADPPASRPP